MDKVVKRPQYQTIDGMLFAAMFSPKCIKEAMDYKPKSDDVFIVTYPKCGTTWMQNIVLYIYRKGKPLDSKYDFFKMCPFIDMLGAESIEGMPRPGALKTHLPYDRMPYSPEARYIFVVRNPKDCCVSLFHHTKMLGYYDGDFDNFFELFIEGEVDYNDYFDHLMSWYPHRNDQKLFHTTYEAMKKDTTGTVVKVANFLGKEYGQAVERDNSLLRDILHYSGFEYMKKNLGDIYDEYTLKQRILKDPSTYEGLKHLATFAGSSVDPSERPPLEFVRKGVVGDWKNHLSGDQVERLNAKFLDRTKGTEIGQWF